MARGCTTVGGGTYGWSGSDISRTAPPVLIAWAAMPQTGRKRRKRGVRHVVRVNLYRLVQQTVEDAVAYGYRRAHKHTDTPTEDQVVTEVENAVMNNLCDLIDFGGGVGDDDETDLG